MVILSPCLRVGWKKWTRKPRFFPGHGTLRIPIEMNGGVYAPPFPSPFWCPPINLLEKPTVWYRQSTILRFLRDVTPHQESLFLRLTFRHYFSISFSGGGVEKPLKML